MVPEEEEAAAGGVAYFDSDFDWAEHAATAEAQLAAIPVFVEREEEADAPGNSNASCWERFYQRHSRRGEVYKPRRYLPRAFPELERLGCRDGGGGGTPPTLLEVGCGLGSSLAAVLDCHPSVCCFGCDVSPTALELLRAKLPAQHVHRVHAFRCDVASEPAVLQAGVGGDEVGPAAIDAVLLIFTLSAIDPQRHVAVLRHLRAVLRPGSGLLLFRDYGLYDQTQLRSRRRLGERLFARQDGTLACFFTPDYFRALLQECGGWELVECKYACVRNVNRGTGQVMHRVFLHAKARAVEQGEA